MPRRNRRALHAIVLGPPGAGKGTQAVRLAKDHGAVRIATGEMLREAVARSTALGGAVKAALAAGSLVSDATMIALVADRLARRDAARGFVLDGFPRTVAQAAALESLMPHHGPLIVVHIEVPPDELIRRLRARRVCAGCGTNADPAAAVDARCPRCDGPLARRPDDREDVVRERLRIFDETAAPLIRHCERGPFFLRVNGHQPPTAVARAIRNGVTRVRGRMASVHA